eukprot:CAMPEP_0171087472 /NCGR_PEP_ID=MMETSP0766_2-20121228/20166_1 /TAXON_ID=439317 /ORGANISM="Gambierdiscus australes, Strain CAWD 149" /LENGTH=67 /DNA_ID=CAMNT_0011545173 /DNA_START=57 /DNA_END=257 /DNA_ORIENTATION=-
MTVGQRPFGPSTMLLQPRGNDEEGCGELVPPVGQHGACRVALQHVVGVWAPRDRRPCCPRLDVREIL